VIPRLREAPTESAKDQAGEPSKLCAEGFRFLESEQKDAIIQAIDDFENATRADPRFAEAYAGLAVAYWALSSVSLDPREAMDKDVRKYAETALRLATEKNQESSLAEANIACGLVEHRYDWNWKSAEGRFRQAILHAERGLEARKGPVGSLAETQDPGKRLAARAHQWYGRYLMLMGNHDEAQVELEKANELSTNTSITLQKAIAVDMGENLYYQGKYDEAIQQFRTGAETGGFQALWRRAEVYTQLGKFDDAVKDFENALKKEPDHPEVLAELGYLHAKRGKTEDARGILARLSEIERSGQRYVSPVARAVVHVGLGEPDEAFKLLEAAVGKKDEWLVYLEVDPVFSELRRDSQLKSRFDAILDKIGLPR